VIAKMKNITQAETRKWIAVLSVCFMFSILTLLCFNEIPEKNTQLVSNTLSLMIGASFATIYGYYFGDSEGKPDATDSGQA